VDATRYRQPDPAAVAGAVFDGRYRLERLLGMGGMGAVYEAVQLAVDRPVAIKVLKPGLARDLRDVARFQQEARAVAALAHPNTIRLFDFGQVEDGSLFLVMELLRGETLEELIAREAPLAPARAAGIALQIAEALVEAHAHGIVHRDLKPPNIFLAEVLGRQDFVKVLDFGIAKVSGDRAADAPLTSTGVAVGSPRWIAPEQATGEHITGQADLYTLGVIAFEMLTGRSLFSGRTATDLLVAHLSAPVPPLTVHGRALTGPLPDLVRQCLEKLPSARPPGAMAVVEALRAMEGRHLAPPDRAGATAATATPPPARPRGPTQQLKRPDGDVASERPHRQTSRLGGPASVEPQPVGVQTTAFTGPVEVVAFTAPVPALVRTGPTATRPGTEPTSDIDISALAPPVSNTAPTQSLPAETAAGTTGDMPAYAPAAGLAFDEHDLDPTVAVPLVTGETAQARVHSGGGRADEDEIPTDPDATAHHIPDRPPRRGAGSRWPLALAALAALALAAFALSRVSDRPSTPGGSDDPPPTALAPAQALAAARAEAATSPPRALDPTKAPEPRASPEAATETAPTRDPKPQTDPEADPATAPASSVLRTRLASSPSGATVYEGDAAIGKTPLDYEWLPTAPPPPLTLRAPGRADAALPLSRFVPGGETLVHLRRLAKARPPRAPPVAPYERTP
jgi:serine/threonine protein kinase